MVKVTLKKGKEKAAWQRHPWIFSGAIDKIKGKPVDGDLVNVVDSKGEFLAKAFYNSHSRVALRLIEWDESIEINENWFYEKISKAVNARNYLINKETNTCRLIFSEADFLPGLIVDRYADYLAVQISSSGIEQHQSTIIKILAEICKPQGIFDKSDATAKSHENLEGGQGLLWGNLPPEFIEVKENGINYHINIIEGQKSGFYCDQRENREILAKYTANKTVLDCFSYSGGFTLNALKHNAKHVTSVDSSPLAVQTLKENLALNQFASDKAETIQNDVNKQLRVFLEEKRTFDLIVLDPPKYAPSRAAMDRAARAYKDLNRLGMLLLKSGGLLATFSCSAAADLETFKQIIAWAALDAGKEVQFIKQFHQPEDHPIRSSFPEGEYLKGLLVRIV